jgi:hypothetical protein
LVDPYDELRFERQTVLQGAAARQYRAAGLVFSRSRGSRWGESSPQAYHGKLIIAKQRPTSTRAICPGHHLPVPGRPASAPHQQIGRLGNQCRACSEASGHFPSHVSYHAEEGCLSGPLPRRGCADVSKSRSGQGQLVPGPSVNKTRTERCGSIFHAWMKH